VLPVGPWVVIPVANTTVEAEHPKPVVSSNTAGVWALVGCDPRLAGIGRLFADLKKTPAR
jgi:maleate cis-trans isomerase